jgi:four helix bundle protein
MQTRFRFEQLEVWHEARQLNHAIYTITRGFPRDELFGMTSQLRRASVSVASNIAEGSGRNSDPDFAHFLEQSYGSLMETASLIYLAYDEKYLTREKLEPMLDTAERLARRIVALNNSLTVRHSKTPFSRKPIQQPLDPRPPRPSTAS